MKEKLLKLQQLFNEIKDLQYEINKEFKGKLILISPKVNGMWDKDCFDFKIGDINVEEDSIEILFTGIEHDEKVECVDWLDFNQFIEYVILA